MKKVLSILSLLLLCIATPVAAQENEESFIDIDENLVPEFFVKMYFEEPAMTDEEYTEMYNSMKADDNFELVDGAFVKFRKTLPNLMTLEFKANESGPKNLGVLTLSWGKHVLTFNWDREYGSSEKQRYQRLKDYYSGNYYDNNNGTLSKVERDTPVFSLGCYNIIPTSSGNDLIKYSSDNGIEANFYFNSSSQLELRWAKIISENADYEAYTRRGEDFVISGIRKTFTDECVVEVCELKKYEYGYRVVYPNGDIFEGCLKVDKTYKTVLGDIKNIIVGELNGNDFNATCAASINVYNAESFSDMKASLWDGKLISKDNSVKLYIRGEYDEIESISYTQKQQAKEREKKAKAEAAIKQRATLTSKYGKKYVDILYREDKQISDIIITGMPIGLLLEFQDARMLGSLDIRSSVQTPSVHRYDLYNYNTFTHKYVYVGHIWVRDNVISTFVLHL